MTDTAQEIAHAAAGSVLQGLSPDERRMRMEQADESKSWVHANDIERQRAAKNFVNRWVPRGDWECRLALENLLGKTHGDSFVAGMMFIIEQRQEANT